MFRVILIDDEKRALDRLERVMREEPRIIVADKFTNANDAISFLEKSDADIAFLDIEMPDTDGLSLAEKLQTMRAGLEIIFVTAYDQYALSAYKVQAIGYLLKPVELADISRQINKLEQRLSGAKKRSSDTPLRVRCFGPFQCSVDGDDSTPIQWRTVKTEELFAFLVYYQGAAMHKEIIIDHLWPDAEPEKAANYFRVTCTYLRNTLSHHGYTNVLLRDRDSYRLDTGNLKCDLIEFTAAIRNFNDGKDIEWLKQAASSYSSPYLTNKTYEWAIASRVHLEKEYKKIQYQLTDEYIRNKDFSKATASLETILSQDPCDENAAFKLIQIKLKNSDMISALRIYNELQKALKNELGLSPSEVTKQLFNNL